MRVGIVADPHAPFTHPLYRRFCQDVFAEWRVNQIHFAGDITDGHAWSHWERNPNGHSAEDEAEEAYAEVQRWVKVFPVATVCEGNHDIRNIRLANAGGLPTRFLKTHKQLWGTPKWNWAWEHTLDGVSYLHGTGASGKDGAINLAMKQRRSTVIGHLHAYLSVKYHASRFDRIFGCNTGCGVDIDAIAFVYGKESADRAVLGCSVVIDGIEAYCVPMPCGKGEKYHKSKAGRKHHGR